MDNDNYEIHLVLFTLTSLAQKGGEVVRFSEQPKNEPHSPSLQAKRAIDISK
jgi:hypothetical protein